jgi:hypothetical protein
METGHAAKPVLFAVLFDLEQITHKFRAVDREWLRNSPLTGEHVQCGLSYFSEIAASQSLHVAVHCDRPPHGAPFHNPL